MFQTVQPDQPGPNHDGPSSTQGHSVPLQEVKMDKLGFRLFFLFFQFNIHPSPQQPDEVVVIGEPKMPLGAKTSRCLVVFLYHPFVTAAKRVS